MSSAVRALVPSTFRPMLRTKVPSRPALAFPAAELLLDKLASDWLAPAEHRSRQWLVLQ